MFEASYGFDYTGQAAAHQKIVPGNTATGIDAKCIKYREWTFTFNSGGTTEIVAGGWIVGATSSARARVVSVTVDSGTWAGGNVVGTLRIASVSGTFDGTENISYGATANDATMTSILKLCQDDYPLMNREAKYALIQVSAQTALLCWDGSTPDQTSLIGQPFPANSSIGLKDATEIRNFKCIDYTAGSASTVQVTLSF